MRKQKFNEEKASTENSVYTWVGNREMGYESFCDQNLGF